MFKNILSKFDIKIEFFLWKYFRKGVKFSKNEMFNNL